jgi:hypothetical protein
MAAARPVTQNPHSENAMKITAPAPPPTDSLAILAVLRRVTKRAALLNNWPDAAAAVVLGPALALLAGEHSPTRADCEPLAHKLWSGAALPIQPTGEPLDLVLSRAPLGVAPNMALVDLLRAMTEAGSVAATLERERDALNAAILELGRLRSRG